MLTRLEQEVLKEARELVKNYKLDEDKQHFEMTSSFPTTYRYLGNILVRFEALLTKEEFEALDMARAHIAYWMIAIDTFNTPCEK